MTMRLTRICVLNAGLLITLLASPAAMAADAPDVVEQKCADCHGKDGISSDENLPSIAGASGFFLENQMAIFREEARPCEADAFEGEEDASAANHCKLAAGLADDAIAAVAKHYSAQPFEPADQPVDQALADKGASIHEAACSKCHSNGGSLALDDAGILAGQWKPYLMEQLEYYKAGKRWQPEKMKPTIDELSEPDMKALVEYYASQGEKRFE